MEPNLRQAFMLKESKEKTFLEIYNIPCYLLVGLGRIFFGIWLALVPYIVCRLCKLTASWKCNNPQIRRSPFYNSRWMTYRIFWVKYVWRRWVIDYYDLRQFPAQFAKVFNIVSFVEHAGLPKQPRMEHVPFVQEVCHRVSILERKEENLLQWLHFNYANYSPFCKQCP